MDDNVLNQLARFEITRAEIANVVARFYHQVASG